MSESSVSWSPSSSSRPSWRLLGPLDGSLDGHPLEPGPPLRRALLALLVAHAGAPVGVAAIVDTLWGERPPEQATNVVQKHVSALRRLIQPDLPRRSAGRWLLPAGDGYRIDVDQAELDVVSFRALVRDARRAREPGPRLARLVEALSLWRGQAGDGVRSVFVQSPVFFSLNREHATIAITAADLALEVGRPDNVLPALRSACAVHPLDELLHAQLIRLLAAAGLRVEALEHYAEMRNRLRSELGLEPGPALQAAQADALADDRRAGKPAAAPPATLPLLAQLPADQPAFVAREREQRQLLELADQSADRAEVAVITGAPGLGKTILAVHVAHRLAAIFSDGCLYVDLRGFDPDQAQRDPGEVLGWLLDALGVARDKIPADRDARSALFRSVLTGRRVLLLLDNARDAQQIRPLLPGSAGSLVIVTSRSQLLGLRTAGAYGLALLQLDLPEIRQFLAARLGSDRLADEDAAVSTLAELSGGLPLALAVTSARAAQFPDVPIRLVAEQLRSMNRRLDNFADAVDPRVDVRSVFSWSYQALSAEAATLFSLLAVHPGPSMSLASVAGLAGIEDQRARTQLDELAAGGLTAERLPGVYQSHDLLRAYSADLLIQAPRDQVAAARDRLYDYASRQAVLAARGSSPDRILKVDPEVPEGAMGSVAVAQSWFDVELDLLINLVERTDGPEYDVQVWRIAWALLRVLDERGRWDAYLMVLAKGVQAARRSGGWFTQMTMHVGLSRALARRGSFEEALTNIDAALSLSRVDRSAPGLSAEGLRMARGELWRSRSWTLENSGAPLELALRAARTGLAEYPTDDRSIYRAHALAAVGWLETRLGQHDAALAKGQEALRVLEANPPYPQGRADTLEVLGHAHYSRGDYSASVNYYVECIRIWQELGFEASVAQQSVSLAEVLVSAGDPEGARNALEQALDIYERMGDQAVEDVQQRLKALSSRVSSTSADPTRG